LTIEVRRVTVTTGRQASAATQVRGNLVLVESDSGVATALMDAAVQIGIETTWSSDGAEALLAVGVDPPDVLVLAARTDTVDAPSITAAVRGRWELPILIGAAPDDQAVARRAMAAGASAVIARPYDITAIAPFAITGADDEPAVFVAGPIRVDRFGHETRVRGRDVQLTQRELDLLVFLIQRRGKVANANEISNAVWGGPSETNTVAVHVKRLREKLGHDAQHGEYIRTIRGAGYRLAPSIYD
jgi:DNA-binding response OmpR family regulator